MKYTGIIISKRDIAEVDRLYNIFTLEKGKIQIVGRGVRKASAKLSGSLEPITESEIFISKTRGRGNITGAIAINNYASLKSNYSALSRVFFAFAHFNRLITQEEKDEEIFKLLQSYLGAMDKQSDDEKSELKSEIITQGFIFKLLARLGYEVVVDYCVDCGGKIIAGNNFFSAKKGGVVCYGCSSKENSKLNIKDQTIKLIRIFIANRIENFSKLEVCKADVDNLKIISEEMMNWVRA